MRLSTLSVLAASLALAPAVSAQTFPSTGAAVAIQDGPGPACQVPAAAGSLPITVASTVAGNIADLNVRVNITHTWVGDIDATVTRGATSVIIIDNPGAGAATTTACGAGSNNMNGIILDDEGTAPVETPIATASAAEAYATGGVYTPNNSLTAFDGQAAAGTYTLAVTDGGPDDTGTLDSWALIITRTTTASEGNALPAGYAFELGGANPARTSTQFNLSVGEAQIVRVALYDALGREVRVVFDEAIGAGQTAFVGVSVANLPAGAYVARATGTAFSAAVPVTVVR